MESSKSWKKLGEILIAAGLISPKQLEEALQEQRKSGEFLGETLQRLEWVTEEQILEALSDQFKIPFQRLQPSEVDWAVAGQFSKTVLFDRNCIPFRADEESITVALSDPLDAWAVSELERQARGKKIHLVLGRREEISALLKEHRRRTFQKVNRSLRGPS